MKIIGPTSTVTSISANEGHKRAEKALPAGHASSQGGDDVHLSALSSKLQSLESSLAASGIIDVAKVEEIKQAISEGRFKVNPEAVADRLLDTVRELLRAHKGRNG